MHSAGTVRVFASLMLCCQRRGLPVRCSEGRKISRRASGRLAPLTARARESQLTRGP
jgi:hypothetical protein